MRYDDESLDRALFALELASPPADLRPRILAATVYAAVPAFRTWELYVIGVALAIATWLAVALARLPELSDMPFVRAFESGVASLGAPNYATLMWLAGGAAIAYFLTQVSLPGDKGARPHA